GKARPSPSSSPVWPPPRQLATPPRATPSRSRSCASEGEEPEVPAPGPRALAGAEIGIRHIGERGAGHPPTAACEVARATFERARAAPRDRTEGERGVPRAPLPARDGDPSTARASGAHAPGDGWQTNVSAAM